jgi:hypothetical protein
VYRRIRGEKAIDLLELKKICEHYQVSLDQLLQLKNESVVFNAPGLNNAPADFAGYMQRVLAQFKYFNSFDRREIFYLCKDAPIWYFYLYPELAAFKTFFWSKTINNQPDLANKQFSFEEFPYTVCFKLGQQVLEEHNIINSVELWNLESIHSTIVRSFHQWLDHLQLQAEKGVKFLPGASDVSHKASIQFYVNELILGNNTMVIQLDDQHLSMVTYSVFYYLFTKDPRFSANVLRSFNTLLTRSSLVSNTGEKERNRFFNALRSKVNSLVQ